MGLPLPEGAAQLSATDALSGAEVSPVTWDGIVRGVADAYVERLAARAVFCSVWLVSQSRVSDLFWQPVR